MEPRRGAALVTPLLVYKLITINMLSSIIPSTLYSVKIDDALLISLHRGSIEAGRPGIAIPSIDLDLARLPHDRRAAARSALFRLANAGRISRVRRDLVVLPDVTGISDVSIADLVDAVAIRPYLITAGAALAHHELTDQHFFDVVILVANPTTTFDWRGQTARFFAVEHDNIWGAGSPSGPQIATAERALLDALNHPRYGVGFTHVLDAMRRAHSRDQKFLSRLERAVEHYSAGAARHGARSCARRIGLIVETLFGEKAARPYAKLIGSNRAPVLLRPSGSRHGQVDPKWRVVVNAPLLVKGTK